MWGVARGACGTVKDPKKASNPLALLKAVSETKHHKGIIIKREIIFFSAGKKSGLSTNIKRHMRWHEDDDGKREGDGKRDSDKIKEDQRYIKSPASKCDSISLSSGSPFCPPSLSLSYKPASRRSQVAGREAQLGAPRGDAGKME